MAARKSTGRTSNPQAGFAVALTADEVFAIQDFAELERAEAMKRIAAAASSGRGRPRARDTPLDRYVRRARRAG
jgi:hypothetical protein